MLTQEQKEKFVEMCDENYGYIIGVDDVVETMETMDDFISQWGKGTDYKGLLVWEAVQKNGKGTERGDLMVADFGDARAAYFG